MLCKVLGSHKTHLFGTKGGKQLYFVAGDLVTISSAISITPATPEALSSAP